MRLLWVFLLFAVNANAQTPLDAPEPVEDYCYENNIEKCNELGYTKHGITETVACPDSGGIACPFDTTQWNCTTWSCKDFNLYDPGYQPANAESCTTVTVKDRTCWKCSCSAGLNVPGCTKINALKTGAVTCQQMGYTQKITDCSDYMVCPADSTKVHCLDQLCEETGCRARVAVPLHAIAETQELTCSCDSTKKKRVPVSWSTCEPGYEKKTVNGQLACVEKNCVTGLFEDDDIVNCYSINTGTLFASGGGWSIAEDQANFTGLKKCYKCTCNCDANTYPYVGADRDENVEEYTEPCCSGERYKKCERHCPTGLVVLPQYAVVDTKGTCEACGQSSEYIISWRCPNGYVKSKNGTGCDIELCPSNQAGNYYDTLFNSVADCAQIWDGEGWQYVAEPKKNNNEVIKSGEFVCHKCYCPYFANYTTYKYTGQGSAEYMDLGGLSCNGRYKTCAWSAKADEDHLTNNPDDTSTKYDTIQICHNGTSYEHIAYRFAGCKEGFATDDDITCHPKDCSEYTLTTDIGANNTLFHTEACLSGTTTKYRVTACDDDVVNNIDYEVLYNPQGYGIDCCNNNCPDGYELDKVCPAGKEGGVVSNACGRSCVRCQP